MTTPLVLTARSLLLDALAAEVCTAFREAGVRSILLKGASVASWLYLDGSVRPYGDVDLLVAPEQKQRAEEALRQLGFAPLPERLPPEAYRARAWCRHDGTVDLHHRISMDLGVPDAESWSLLSASTVPLRVGGAELEILGPAARTLLVVLHAAAHGAAEPKPLEDLTRAIVQVPETTWRDAAELADGLGAARAMSVGLALVPGGTDLGVRLGLPREAAFAGVLCHAGGRLGLLVRLARRPPGGRVRLMARHVFPTSDYIRQRYVRHWPRRAQGSTGLAVGYLWRLCRGLSELRHAVGLLASRLGPRLTRPAWPGARTERS